MKNLKIFTLFLPLLIMNSLAALETPELTLPVMPKSPVIDGIVNESEYKYAARMQGTCLNTRTLNGKLYPAEMIFYIGADKDNLYIAVKRAVGKSGLRSRVLPNPDINPPTFSDDSLETVIIADLAAAAPKIIHSNINNRGAVYKMAKTKTSMLPFNGKWKSKGSVRDNVWHFESAVSWKDLGLSAIPAKSGARICMNWKNVKGHIQTAWEPQRAEFFGQTYMPVINWRKDAAVVQVHDARNYTGSIHKDGKALIFNPSAKDISVKVKYHFFPESSHDLRFEKIVNIPAGKSVDVTLGGGPLSKTEKVTWKLHVTSVDGKIKYYVREYIAHPSENPDVFTAGKNNSSGISYSFAYYPSYKKMLLRANMAALDKKAPAKYKAVIRQDKKVIAELNFGKPAANGIALIEYDTPDFGKMIPAGKTSAAFEIDFYDNGKKINTQKFEHHKLEWINNNLGKSDIIVPPFTGIKFNNDTVSVLLRDYKLNSLGLPAQINAKNNNILKDNGFTLSAVVNGRKHIASGKLRTVKKGVSFLKLASDWTAGTLKGTSLGTWDQDGTLKYELTLKKGSTVDALTLEIPIDDAQAPLMHSCGDGARINYAGFVPKGNGKIWDASKIIRLNITNYVPYIWLGGEERGISVFGENDKNWSKAANVPEFELFRKNGKLTLVLNIISEKTKLDSDRRILLGFMATPVKPMPENFRRWNAWAHFSAKGVNAQMVRDGYFTYSTNLLGSGLYFGTVSACSDVYPANQDMGYLRKMAEARKTGKRPDKYILDWLKKNFPAEQRTAHRRGHLLNGFNRAMGLGNDNIFYFNARGARYKSTPEGRHFANEWHKGMIVDREHTDEVAYDVDPAESYRDYNVFYYKKILETGAMDQMYWDDIFLSPNSNIIGSEAYLRPNGSIQPASGIFNMRELVRRSGYLMAEMKRTPRFMIHMTSTNIAPIVSYGAMHFDWEENLGYIDFQDRHPRDYIRAMSIGRQVGNFPVMLVATTGNPPSKASYKHWIRTAAGVMLTHELRWHKPYNEFWTALKIMFDCGYAAKGAKVFNYWDKNYPANITGGETSSVLSVKDGKAVIMVCDWSGGGEYTLSFDKKLKLNKNFKAYDAEKKTGLKIENGKIKFNLKKHDFIIIELK
ncbi:MAG: hypothetical protein IKB77_05005 [Lentisphaeria bacterium]|nr:hypothetical protein [Lentisphaeria bacterium]